MGAKPKGITLIEVLVALTIFSMVIASVMQFSDYVTRRIFTIRQDVTHLDQLVAFMNVLSDDVRGSRQIIYSTPQEVGIWRADENADSTPDPVETVGYAWDGESPGSIYRQAGENRTIVLSDVRYLEFNYDRPSPLTRHVVLELLVGKSLTDVHRYQFSLNLRASDLY